MTDVKSTPSNTKEVQDLPAEAKRYERGTQTKGLRVRVHPTGRKEFVWYFVHPFKINRQTKKPIRSILVLGDCIDETKTNGGIPYGTAGDLLEEAKAKVSQKLDPNTIFNKREQAPAPEGVADPALITKPVTLGDLAMKFYQQRIATKRDRAEVPLQVLSADIIPAIGGLELTAITQDHLLIPVHNAMARGAYGQALNVWRLINQMMRWGKARRQYDGENPLDGLSLDNAGLEINSQPKDRVLTDKEITAFFTGMANSNTCKVKQLALQLLLLIGTRTREIRLLETKYIDLDNNVLTIPVALQKSRKKVKGLKPRRIPLSPEAVVVVRQLMAINGHTGYLLTAPGTGKVVCDSGLRNCVAALNKRLGIDHWSPHDLRRTYRTTLQHLKVPFEVAESAIGHSLPEVVRTYVVSDLFDERREANIKLAKQLAPLMGISADARVLQEVA